MAPPRVVPPIWKVTTIRKSRPRRKRGIGATVAVLVLLFVVGAVSDGPGDLAARALPGAGVSTPSPQAPRPSTLDQAGPGEAGSARALLAGLEVKGRAARTGYDRDLFGQAWADTDRNGCDTRNDVLERDLTGIVFKAGTGDCKVLAGTLDEPFTGRTIAFSSSDGSAVQIDHVVALSDAWQKGAQQWEPGKRLAFANDPLNLLAVHGPTNASKGDGDAATWLPPDRGYWCPLVARQVAVKAKYELAVTAAERDAMARVLSSCPAEVVPTSSAPTVAPIAPRSS